MPTIELTDADWRAIWNALLHAAEEVGYDLYDTRNSDFYEPEDRDRLEEKAANWERLATLIEPLTSGTTNAKD